MVEPTHLKNMSQNENLPQVEVKISRNVWNHHLAMGYPLPKKTWKGSFSPNCSRVNALRARLSQLYRWVHCSCYKKLPLWQLNQNWIQLNPWNPPILPKWVHKLAGSPKFPNPERTEGLSCRRTRRPFQYGKQLEYLHWSKLFITRSEFLKTRHHNKIQTSPIK